MTYVDGFVVAVPAANKDAYLKHAAAAAPLFKEFGATRFVECWGEDVPDGKVTDFRGSVKAEDGEVVVFSWMEYPSREARDAAAKKMMSDPRMEKMGSEMPFDGKRMIYGGFAPILDVGESAGMRYADGFLVPVPDGNKDAYLAMATKMAALFREHGATRVVEAWGDDVPDGKVTDFRRAVKAEAGETVVFSWVQWPSKAAREDGWKKIMADERMKTDHSTMAFDGKRMIYGGFTPILEA